MFGKLLCIQILTIPSFYSRPTGVNIINESIFLHYAQYYSLMA